MHKNCIVCKNKDIFTKYIINGFHIFQCRQCSLLFVGEKLSQEELKMWYEQKADVDCDYTYADQENIENLKFYYLKLADWISKKMPTGKILDIGCSGGYFLDYMKGWDCHGIEISSLYAEKAKAKHGNNIHTGTVEDYEYKKEYFDVITLQDVLDHMPDPLQALAKCNSLLKPGGIIVIKVHDISCLFAKLLGPRFYAFVPIFHLVYFNKKNLIETLSMSGFKTEEYKYLAHLLFLKTIFYRLSQDNKKNFFYKLYNVINRSSLRNIKIKKNLYDIITVFARKEIV
ncbi:MAG: class I SAM-dependent methyltransferase [bacterium]|nr:class I SAM-dependent methyltransferase [bacterium]